MPLPENYNLDRAFRLAGFIYGKPSVSNPKSPQTLAALFDDDILERAYRQVSTARPIPLSSEADDRFDALLAAELIEICIAAGYFPDGRTTDATGMSVDDRSFTYNPSISLSLHRSRARTLRQP